MHGRLTEIQDLSLDLEIAEYVNSKKANTYVDMRYQQVSLLKLHAHTDLEKQP